MRKQRTAYSGVWRASALGHNEGIIVSGSATKKVHITNFPVYSNWHEHFIKGLEKFMGRDTKQDLALDMKVIVLVMKYIEEQRLLEMDIKEKRFLILIGLVIKLTDSFKL